MDAKEVARQVLTRMAFLAEDSAEWTENNFLPGPNTAYAIRHNREMAAWLLEEANDPYIWVPKEDE